MRILIASDIHGAPDSVTFLQARIRALQPDLCVLLGDYLYHGPRNPLPTGYTPRDVARMLGELTVEVLAVRGNCDAEVDEGILPFPLTEKAWIQTDGLRILALHGHTYGLNPEFSDIKAGTVMLTGHTHIPAAETRGHVHWWNPGSITLPKNGYSRSYGVYEAGEFRVFDMHGTCLMQHSIL